MCSFHQIGVDMPVEVVASVLREQVEWERKPTMKSSPENLHKRYYGFIIGQCVGKVTTSLFFS